MKQSTTPLVLEADKQAVQKLPRKQRRPVSRYQWPLERLFGKKNWCLPWLIELCEENDRFFLHLTEQRQDYIHFLCLVRCAMLELDYCGTSISFQARWLLQHPKKLILKDLYPDIPEGTIGVLGRLGPQPLPQDYYPLLLEFLADKAAGKLLRHKPRVYKRDLDMLTLLVETDKCNPVTEWAKCSKDYTRIEYFVRVAQTINPGLPRKNIVQTLLKFKNKKQFSKWMEKQLGAVSFPPPVWAGNDWIHPVTHAADLKSTARHFQNCCYDYLTRILSGHYYIYVSEEGPAVIGLVNDALLGWEVDEIKGGSGRKVLLPNSKTRILSAFAGAGIPERSEYRWHEELDDFLI
jgi:hypothetical protein